MTDAKLFVHARCRMIRVQRTVTGESEKKRGTHRPLIIKFSRSPPPPFFFFFSLEY